MLPRIIEALQEKGLLVDDAGAKCVFLEGFTNKDILRLAKEQDVRIHDDVKKAVVE